MSLTRISQRSQELGAGVVRRPHPTTPPAIAPDANLELREPRSAPDDASVHVVHLRSHIDDLTQADPLQARGRAIPPARPGPRGLVIARRIVEAHGGRLWAGAAARGASVRFYLPATARTGA